MKKFPSIKKNTEFRDVYSHGVSKSTPLLVMYKEENSLGFNRIGISASKKVGNSVVRHRQTRRIRELFRLYNNDTVQGTDIIVVVRNRAAAADFEKLRIDYEKLLAVHGLFKKTV